MIRTWEAKPQRILVALPAIEGGPQPWEGWGEAMVAQKLDGWSTPFDVVVIDMTDQPSPSYLSAMRKWSSANQRPFRVRLKHFMDEPHIIRPEDFVGGINPDEFLALAGEGARSGRVDIDDADTLFDERGPVHTNFGTLWQRVAWAQVTAARYFDRWSSYSHLVMADPAVLPPPAALGLLQTMDVPLAAAWVPPGNGEPQVWKHDPLDPPIKVHGSIGYMEPPGKLPFKVAATHLKFTMLTRQATERVEFQVDYMRNDLSHSARCNLAKLPLVCNPNVVCELLGQGQPAI